MMMNPAFCTELLRFRMEQIRRSAEHHRSWRNQHSPRRPDAELEHRER